jgi:hypothetical protein
VAGDLLGLVEAAFGVARRMQRHGQQHRPVCRRAVGQRDPARDCGARRQQRPEQPRRTQVAVELERAQAAAYRILVAERCKHGRDVIGRGDERQGLQTLGTEVDGAEVAVSAAQQAPGRQTGKTRPREPRQPRRALPQPARDRIGNDCRPLYRLQVDTLHAGHHHSGSHCATAGCAAHPLFLVCSP